MAQKSTKKPVKPKKDLKPFVKKDDKELTFPSKAKAPTPGDDYRVLPMPEVK